MILVEQSKPDEEQNKLITKLYSQIQGNIKLASALNLGTPVVAQIKAMVDKAQSASSLSSSPVNSNESHTLCGSLARRISLEIIRGAYV
jgi:hypothetical protein